MQEIKVGSYTGNGAAQNISLGFVPDHIRIWNATDGDTFWEWFKGMAAANALQATNHASAQFSLITSNGISAYDGNLSTSPGFTIGTALSEDTKVFRYVAVRNDAP